MIRKKKFMAIAVASLFVAPVMANSDDYTININGLQGKNGFIVANDELFQKALTESKYKNTVYLTMYGNLNFPQKLHSSAMRHVGRS